VAWRDADGWLREGLIAPGTGLVPRLAPVFSALAGPVTLGVQWLLLLVVLYPVLRGVSFAELHEQINQNTARFFGIPAR
jgi:hypothetical protein